MRRPAMRHGLVGSRRGATEGHPARCGRAEMLVPDRERILPAEVAGEEEEHVARHAGRRIVGVAHVQVGRPSPAWLRMRGG